MTPKQRHFLRGVRTLAAELEQFPTYSQIMTELDIASPNSVTQYLRQLEALGYLAKSGSSWRFTIAACCPHCGQRLEDAA
jgi:hypothetical protein